MRILITEDLPAHAVQLLRDEGWTVDFLRDMPGKSLQDVIAGYDAIVVRSGTRVTEAILERARRLRVIGRPGAGVDNIDVEAATRRGVLVMNTPGQNSIAAAEHALALMLCALRNLYPAIQSMKQQQWERRRFIGNELTGKTVGIVGLGRVGRELAHRLRALHAHILAYDPYVPLRIAREMDVELVELHELLARSDIVSLHIPLTPETRHMFNWDRFQQMKRGSILVNCARGEVIDEAALVRALDEGILRMAALDVFSEEPPRDWTVITHPRVIATPHIGGSTVEAHEKVALQIAIQIRDYLKYGVIGNAVNFPSVPETARPLVSAFMRLGYALGQIAHQLTDFRIQSVQIEYLGTVAQKETRPILAAVVAGVLRPAMGDEVNWVNAIALAEDRGLMLIEQRQIRSYLYENLLRVSLLGSAGEVVTVDGTVIPPGRMRLVTVWNATVDVPMHAQMVIVRNRDVPGAIGNIGLCLGRSGINIGYFGLARLDDSGEAVGVMDVDQPVEPHVLNALRDLPMVLDARYVRVELEPPVIAHESPVSLAGSNHAP